MESASCQVNAQNCLVTFRKTQPGEWDHLPEIASAKHRRGGASKDQDTSGITTGQARAMSAPESPVMRRDAVNGQNTSTDSAGNTGKDPALCSHSKSGHKLVGNGGEEDVPCNESDDLSLSAVDDARNADRLKVKVDVTIPVGAHAAQVKSTEGKGRKGQEERTEDVCSPVQGASLAFQGGSERGRKHLVGDCGRKAGNAAHSPKIQGLPVLGA